MEMRMKNGRLVIEIQRMADQELKNVVRKNVKREWQIRNSKKCGEAKKCGKKKM